MKLTRKHIGQLFDTTSGDGTWCIQLLDVDGAYILFNDYGTDKYWIQHNRFKDWTKFEPKQKTRKEVRELWKTATREN